jgi:hypothetical protein
MSSEAESIENRFVDVALRQLQREAFVASKLFTRHLENARGIEQACSRGFGTRFKTISQQ